MYTKFKFIAKCFGIIKTFIIMKKKNSDYHSVLDVCQFL